MEFLFVSIKSPTKWQISYFGPRYFADIMDFGQFLELSKREPRRIAH